MAIVLSMILLLSPAIGAAQNLLRGPQKIVIDAAHERLLVSNYTTGDIVQIDDAGNQSYFVQGAGFVDGMEIVGGTVYGVASGRRILGYDLDTAQQVMTVTLPGVGYLSSIVKDDAGCLYISCPLRHEIWKLRLSDLANWTFVSSGSGLANPNGMILQAAEHRLVVIEDRANPSIQAVSLADSTVTTLATTTLAGGDGIAQDMAGSYYVTGYYLPGIYRFDPDFSQPPVMIYEGSGIVYPTYDAEDNSLLVTCYNTNTWVRIPLGASDARPAETPGTFQLNQSYPNPFNPSTVIGFEMSAAGRARLAVYDAQGKQVRTLLDEARESGRHAVRWDGTDDLGRAAASGAYYYCLVVDGETQTRKAILAK